MNCFASIRICNTRLSTRSANRTHARKRAVSSQVIQITINTVNYKEQFLMKLASTKNVTFNVSCIKNYFQYLSGRLVGTDVKSDSYF
jgi:hypothetical protein